MRGLFLSRVFLDNAGAFGFARSATLPLAVISLSPSRCHAPHSRAPPEPAARRSSIVRALSFATLLVAVVVPPRAAHAQSLEDAELLNRATHATVMYGHDAWNAYWEGSLKRSNDNVGTVSTSGVTWTAAYGVNDASRCSLAPYVWTDASQGVLRRKRDVPP